MAQTDSYIVLCIEERDDLKEKYDNILSRLFVAYDADMDEYVVYGKRIAAISSEVNYQPYFFRTDSATEMYKFVKFVIGRESVCSFTLYNYNNMLIDLESSDYEFMVKNMSSNYEMVIYDNVLIKKRNFKKIMDILKNMFNY